MSSEAGLRPAPRRGPSAPGPPRMLRIRSAALRLAHRGAGQAFLDVHYHCRKPKFALCHAVSRTIEPIYPAPSRGSARRGGIVDVYVYVYVHVYVGMGRASLIRGAF